MNIIVIKKDGREEAFNPQKIIDAVKKSADRISVTLTFEQYQQVVSKVQEVLTQADNKVIIENDGKVDVKLLHQYVEMSLMFVDHEVSQSYRSYRNYKMTLCEMSDTVWNRTQTILYRGDKENSNADSTLVSTKQSLIRGEISRQFYRQFFLKEAERLATKQGFIYIHDERDRLYTMNCCLADISNIMTGGFENANLWINEPNTLDVACDVVGDIILSMSAQQYGK